MSSISCARILHITREDNRVRSSAPSIAAAGRRNVIRMFALTAAAASLAACAQSSVTKYSERPVASRQASLEHRRPIVATRTATETQTASHGVASFYSTGKQTANGEAFDARALTAAHRTLPFGTRLRVTNVATGQSVTVRVNDRGPFIPGRVVDVSHSAAEALGMVEDGVAKVKVDVVR